MYIMRICRITVNRRLEGVKILEIWGQFHKVTGGKRLSKWNFLINEIEIQKVVRV